MQLQRTQQVLRWIISNVDIVLTVLIAFYACYIGVFGGKIEYAVALTALAISTFAFSILRTRTSTDRLNSAIHSISKEPSADVFFGHLSKEKDYIYKAKKQVLLIQETGHLVAENCRQELVTFLKSGGKLEIAIVSKTDEIAKLMSLRNKQILDKEKMMARMENGINTIDIIKRESGNYAANIEVRFIPYPIDFTGVFIDPCSEKEEERIGLVRLQGFKVPYDEKPDFHIAANLSGRIYKNYLNQAKKIWGLSYKCTLLCGPSKIGKTTLLSKFLKEMTKDNKITVRGFLTEEVLNLKKERIGFDIKIISTGEIHELSRKDKSGKPVINGKGLSAATAEILECVNLFDINFFLDEIGIIQSESREFRESVSMLIKNHRISIYGTISNSEEDFFTEIKNNIRVGIIHVTATRMEAVSKTLCREIEN